MRIVMVVLTMWGASASAQMVGPITAPAPRAPNSYRIDAGATVGRDTDDVRERIEEGATLGTAESIRRPPVPAGSTAGR